VLYEDVQAAAERNGETATDAVIWGLQQYLERDSWRDRALAAEAELRRIKGEQ
jgi:hypothetical protein